jgi:hypothetical protein
MNKRTLHHLWTKLRWIKPWYFLALALVSVVVCVFALRANNQHMAVLRDAVKSADKDNTDIQAPLKELQAYVTTHMNTNLSSNTSIYPPIQLKYTYDRLKAAETQNLSKTNSSLYNDAQHYCEGQNSTDFSGRNRVPCIEQYVESHSSTQAPVLPAIPDALYKFDFVSPRWSADLAGWTMLLTVLSALLFVVTFSIDQAFKRILK